jgi:hypothetical protein
LGVRVPPGVRVGMLPQDAAILAQLAATTWMRKPCLQVAEGGGGEALVVQLAETPASKVGGCRFESGWGYVSKLRKRRHWVRWRRYEMRSEKLAGVKDPLWWGAVWAGAAFERRAKSPRWLR